MRITAAQSTRLVNGQRAVFDRELASAFDHPQALSITHSAVARAVGLGFCSYRGAASYVALRRLLGEGFETDPFHAWASSPGLLDEGFAFLWQAAGPNGEHETRAVERLRSWTMAGNAIASAHEVYPERARAVTEAGFAEAARSARALGLSSPRGELVHAVLAFWLGHGYATDPMNGWARDAFAQGGDELERRLVAGAIAALSERLPARSCWRQQLWSAAKRPLSHVDDAVAPREALVALCGARRRPDEAPGIRLWHACDELDAPGNHWVVPVNPRHIVVEAETRPDDEAVWRRLSWSGGEALEGAPEQRRFAGNKPGHHSVSVSLDGRTASMEIWVVEASIEMHRLPDGLELAVQLAPPEVGRYVRSRWRMRRERHAVRFRNGVEQSILSMPASRGPWSEAATRLESPYPSATGTLKGNIQLGLESGLDAAAENHRAWLEWGGEPCSNILEWHFRGGRRVAGAPPVIEADSGLLAVDALLAHCRQVDP